MLINTAVSCWMDGWVHFLNREQTIEAGWFVAGICVGYFIAI